MKKSNNNERKTLEVLFKRNESKQYSSFEEKHFYKSISESKIYRISNIDKIFSKSILYKQCEFHGVNFNKMKFSNAYFQNCKFYNCNFNHCTVEFDQRFCFDICRFFMCTFSSSRIDGSWFTECFFNHVDFKDCCLFGSFFAYNTYNSVQLIGKCDISDIKIFKPKGWFALSINDYNLIKCSVPFSVTDFDYKTKVKELEGMDYRLSMHSPSGRIYNSDAVAKTFMNLAYVAAKNNHYENYSFCYHYSKQQEHKKLRWNKKIGSFLAQITCGYGEKPWNGVWSALGLITFCSFIYLNGIKWKKEIIDYQWSPNKEGLTFTLDKFTDWLKCLYFSMTTFTTVGYGDAQALGLASRIASFFEMFIGIFLTAIIAGTILRKILRSTR